MRTLRVNITPGREPGVAAVRMRLGNKFVRATLRGFSIDDLVAIALNIPQGGDVLMRLLHEAAGRRECFAKASLRHPWVEWDPTPEDPAP